MRRYAIIFILALASWAAWATEAIGQVQYVEGDVSYSRDGVEEGALDIGTDLLAGDLVRTAPGGRVTIAIGGMSGMAGTLTVNPASSLYLNFELYRGERRTSIDLLSGSIGAKVKKIVGSPTMQVQTATAIAGVRGTEFEVATSLNDAVLITCIEGEVSCDDGSSDPVPVPAGKALEKRGGERPRYLVSDPSTIRDLRTRWIEAEIVAFRANPLKAIAAYEKRYSGLSAAFQKAFEPFQNSAVLRKWMEEDRAGKKPRALDPAVMREKRQIWTSLKELRKTLFLFERVYARMDELYGLVKGNDIEGQELRGGYTVGDFFRRFQKERGLLAKRLGLFHYAQKLFVQRDDGSTDIFDAPPLAPDSGF